MQRLTMLSTWSLTLGGLANRKRNGYVTLNAH